MKKIFALIIPTGLLMLFITLFLASERASGAIIPPPGEGAGKNDTEQHGPPWMDVTWHYRRPVTVHSNSSLAWYQVLVRLDGNNFPSFNLTNPGGSDIRFTHSDGTTLLNYWIESWDSAQQLAYIWVRVPGIGSGDTSIFLYYNNPAAESASNGLTTFDGFDDDWQQFVQSGLPPVSNGDENSNGLESPFTWTVVMGTPEASPAGFLTLPNGTGISSQGSYQYQAVGFKANFGLGGGHEWGGFINGAGGARTMIGDLPADVDDLYLINYVNASNTSILEGAVDWHNSPHIYEVRWLPGWSQGDIDHGLSTASSTSQVPGIELPVTFFSDLGANAELVLDWAYLRQFHNPEPGVDIGAQQGLVALNINMADSPDPLQPGERLTYQLSIYNTSSINAPDVVVTDTLPANVQIGPISSSQGSCNPGGVVECNLYTILPNSMVSVSIVVTPTVSGVITNTAQVTSPGFELNFSDNSSVETTLVDSTPPVVNWERPVHTLGVYVSHGRYVLLEASATDNDQVASVDFLYYDHLGSGWTPIGTDTSYPYQVQFDNELLESEQQYLFAIIGEDRAGNRSDPYNPPQYIYIIRRLAVFLPFTRK